MEQKVYDALFLFESDLELAHLGVFDELFQLEESLLEVGLDEFQNFQARLFLRLESFRREGVVILVSHWTLVFALELARVALLHLLNCFLLVLVHFVLEVHQRLDQNLLVVVRSGRLSLQALDHNRTEFFEVTKLQRLVYVFIHLRLEDEIFQLIRNKINDVAHDESSAAGFLTRFTWGGVVLAHAVLESIEEVERRISISC